jgi:diguanylate cyclase (GGDEF)-like protein
MPLWRAPWFLPAAFLLLQLGVFMFAPRHIGIGYAYAVMSLAPLLAAGACAWRARAEPLLSGRVAWSALALAMFTWSLGAADNLWQELILGRANEMYRNAMLAFNLAAVPLTFLLAGEWELSGRRLVRSIDALIALALGIGYFLHIWAMLTARGAPDEAGIQALIRQLDIQNVFLCVGAAIRWRAAVDARERDMFRALALYAFVYMAIVALNNRFLAANPLFDARDSSIVTIAFAVLWTSARRRPARAAPARVDAGVVRIVRSASPIILAVALLVLSLFLIRVDYPAGAAGVLIAVLGYGARNIVAQVRHSEREDSLQRDRSELQTIAWTDALTGVANRRYIDRALERAAHARRHGRRETESYAVLMVDIDHFKGLNDRYGHTAGDSCLRIVARTMQHALARPGDVLARYGGEEFIVLLHDADLHGAQIVAERMRAAVQSLAIEHQASPFGIVTVSIGVASVGIDAGMPPAQLVDAADKALYAAKCSGRNKVAGS